MNVKKKTKNWKTIATALAQRVNWAVTYLNSTGEVINIRTGKVTAWRDYMADGLEMIPGVKVDREIMHTFSLPRNKQKKARDEILAKRARRPK